MARTFRVLTVLASLACAASAFAQSASGHIAGVITDEHGQPVSGVYVTAHSNEQSQRIQTDAEGEFLLHDLMAGRYVLTAARDGYATVVRNGVMVKVGKTASMPLVMKVEQAKEAQGAASRYRNPDAGRTVVASNGAFAMLPAYNPVALLPPAPGLLVNQRVVPIRR